MNNLTLIPKLTLKLVLTASVIWLAQTVLAHQQKQALTKIVFNENSQFIEITHRISLHDAEHAAKKLFGVTMDLLKNPLSQKHFADYVVSQFKVSQLDGTLIELMSLGHEIDGKHLWVYQELPLTELKGLTIEQPILIEVWPSQTNLVNIERAKTVKSLRFTKDSGAQSITFD